MSFGETLRRCSTSSIFDALDEIGSARGGALDDLRVFGARVRAAGPIETVSAEVALVRSYAVDDFSIGAQIRTTPAGSILLIDLLGERVSSWGALATRSAMRGGLEACVIRGGGRDIEEIDRLDFLLAIQHVTPRTGKGRIRFLNRGAAVRWGRVDVAPGDWVVVDRTGAVVVPAEELKTVARRALELEGIDAEFARSLERGEDFDGARRRLGHF